MTTLKLIAIALMAAVLVGPWGIVSDFVPFGTRIILLCVLLVGGVLWVSSEADEEQDNQSTQPPSNNEHNRRD